MRWNILSNKGSSAPYTYLALQVFFLTGAYFGSPYLKSLVNSRYAVFLGLELFITLLLYFITHFRDPGYVPQDGIFFTEQEEQWTRSNMKLQNNPQDSQRLRGEAHVSPAFENMVEEDHSQHSFECKDEENNHVEIEMEFRNDNSNCEQERNNQDLEAATGEDGLKLEDLQPQETLEKELSVQDKLGKIDEITTSAKTNNQTANTTTKDVTEPFSERELNKEQLHIPLYQTSQEANSLVALHTDQKLNTRECNDDSPKKDLADKEENPAVQKNQEEIQEKAEELEVSKVSKPRTPLNRSANNITKTDVSYMEAPGTERVAAPTANFVNEVRKAESKVAEMVLKNSGLHTNSERVNLDENLQVEDLEAPKKEEQQADINYVERRYCTVCNLEQPIRARHCRHCNKCVACYDHHCPWLGSCIGEKNHFFFVWYLLFQLIEAAFAQAELAFCFFDHIMYSIEIRALQVILSIGMGFFTLMVTVLLFFHLYLASQNMTTWEILSWSKISYLKDLQSKKGSPFSEGWKKNLSYFCSTSYKSLRKWRFTPEYKASLEARPNQ